jgi:O-acetylhomoserine (thiol)-lyase
VTASGTAAIHYTALTLARAGDEIVSAKNLYGGTYTQFTVLLKDQGINVKLVDALDPENFRKAITDKTRFLFVEVSAIRRSTSSISPRSRRSRTNTGFRCVDSTFTPPTNYRPIEAVADIVIHSLSKWIGGHGAGIGGVVIDSGKFDWKKGKETFRFSPSQIPRTTVSAGRTTFPNRSRPSRSRSASARSPA